MKNKLYQLKKFLIQFIKEPTYRLWLAQYFFIYLIANTVVLTWGNRIIYFLPFSLLNVIILLIPMVLGVMLTYRYREIKVENSTKFLMSLSSISLLMIIPGLSVIFTNSQTYSPKAITTTVDSNYLQQIFRVENPSDEEIASALERVSSNEPIDEHELLIFVRPECPYCKVSIPVVLSQLSKQEAESIRFIDLSSTNSNRLANILGVEKAATVVSFSKDNGTWKRSIYRLAGGSRTSPTIDENAINRLKTEVAEKSE